MALTTQQLMYINNLLYSTSPSLYGNNNNPQTSYRGKTLGDLVNNIKPEGNAGDTASKAEWESMVRNIKNDPQLMNIQIRDTFREGGTESAGCYLYDPSTGEGIVGFRGTGAGEWKDNFIAGTLVDGGGQDNTLSPQQEKAIDYFKQLDFSDCSSVTVTGHSKGGNKAKVIAITQDNVDRCVSFDGQGFSDAFYEAHQSEISRNQHKIENHCVDGDFVNILLNDVGKRYYYEGQHINGNFAKNHDPSSFVTMDGRMIPAEQSSDMQELDRFINSALRGMNEGQRKETLSFLGDVADAALGGGDTNANMRRVLLDKRNTEGFSNFLASLIQYEHKTGGITQAGSHIMEQMGFTEGAYYVDFATTLMGNDFFYGALKNVMSHGDAIPDWMLSAARAIVHMTGNDIPFSNAELRQILRVVGETGRKLDRIHVDPNNGDDLSVANSAAASAYAAYGGLGGGNGGGGSWGGGADRILVSTDDMWDTLRVYEDAHERMEEAFQQMDRAWNMLEGVWEGSIKALLAGQWMVLNGNIQRSEMAILRTISGLKNSIRVYEEAINNDVSSAGSLNTSVVPPLF